MNAREKLGVKLIIGGIALISGTFALLELSSGSPLVTLLVLVMWVVWMAYNIKFMFFSGEDKN